MGPWQIRSLTIRPANREIWPPLWCCSSSLGCPLSAQTRQLNFDLLWHRMLFGLSLTVTECFTYILIELPLMKHVIVTDNVSPVHCHIWHSGTTCTWCHELMELCAIFYLLTWTKLSNRVLKPKVHSSQSLFAFQVEKTLWIQFDIKIYK